MESFADYISSHGSQTRFLYGNFTIEGMYIGTHSFRYFPWHKVAAVGVMMVIMIIGAKQFHLIPEQESWIGL